MTHFEIYKRPFKFDCPYFWSSNKVMTFTCLQSDNEGLYKIIEEKLNSDDDCYQSIFDSVEVEDGEISIDGKPALLVRGWGHLISCLKLDYEQAAEIQDDFAEYIVNRLRE